MSNVQQEDNQTDESSEEEQIYYKNSKKIEWDDFKTLFKFDENDKSKKELKKEFKKMDKKHKGNLKFKHLIDFYLTSSE